MPKSPFSHVLSSPQSRRQSTRCPTLPQCERDHICYSCLCSCCLGLCWHNSKLVSWLYLESRRWTLTQWRSLSPCARQRSSTSWRWSSNAKTPAPLSSSANGAAFLTPLPPMCIPLLSSAAVKCLLPILSILEASLTQSPLQILSPRYLRKKYHLTEVCIHGQGVGARV